STAKLLHAHAQGCGAHASCAQAASASARDNDAVRRKRRPDAMPEKPFRTYSAAATQQRRVVACSRTNEPQADAAYGNDFETVSMQHLLALAEGQIQATLTYGRAHNEGA